MIKQLHISLSKRVNNLSIFINDTRANPVNVEQKKKNSVKFVYAIN